MTLQLFSFTPLCSLWIDGVGHWTHCIHSISLPLHIIFLRLHSICNKKTPTGRVHLFHSCINCTAYDDWWLSSCIITIGLGTTSQLHSCIQYGMFLCLLNTCWSLEIVLTQQVDGWGICRAIGGMWWHVFEYSLNILAFVSNKNYNK